MVSIDVHVQVFMDEHLRLAHGSHECACTGFFMDARARLAHGSHGWRTRGSHGHGCTGFSWISVRG